MSFWTPSELARFRYIKLDGVKSPGVLQLPNMGDGVPLNWEVRQGWGLSGASQLFRGIGLGEWTFVFRCVDQADRKAWDGPEWQKAIERPPLGAPARKRRIDHPLVNRNKIIDVVILNDPFDQPVEGGAVDYAIKFRDGRKPLPQFSRPKDPDPSRGTPKPQDAADRRIQALMAQIQNLK